MRGRLVMYSPIGGCTDGFAALRQEDYTLDKWYPQGSAQGAERILGDLPLHLRWRCPCGFAEAVKWLLNKDGCLRQRMLRIDLLT